MAINREMTVQKLTAMPREMAARVSDYRFENRLPSEAEAIRRLITIGLEANPILKEFLAFLESSGDADDADTLKQIERLQRIIGGHD